MTPDAAPLHVPPAGAGRWPRPLQWLVLLIASIGLIVPLELAGFPAALLLGPMIAAIAIGSTGARVRVPAPLFTLAQGVVGCMMARALPPAVFVELWNDWPIYLVGILSVVVVAGGLGILLARLRILPGTTAIWGSAPGAAATIVVMADAFGADARIVAFMAYTRVALVALTASIVARVFVPAGAPPPPIDWFPPVDIPSLGMTLAVIVVAMLVARRAKLPVGTIFFSMIFAVLLQNIGGLKIELPPLLLAVSFALVGWTIGLRFTRDILLHALRALPAVMLSLVTLIAVCAGFAFLLVWLAGVDPLTAYLATSPGGADSVAIIAANSTVDVSFVMAMQAGRLLVVTLTGPPLARFIATRKWAREL